MDYGLPKTVNICGTEFAVRYDYRVILEIFEVLNEPDISDQERALAVLQIFYVEWQEIPDYEAAIKECINFINCGRTEEPGKKQPQLVNWEQDYQIIVAPINRVLGYEIRAKEYDPETNTGGVHWYTLVSAYMEIGGDCLFSQVVRIREKKAKGKPLDKAEKEFYRKNRELVDIKRHYTEADDELIEYWTGKK